MVGSCLRGMVYGDFGGWGFQCIQLFTGKLGLGSMIVAYILERFCCFVKHKLRENAAGTAEKSREEARKNELMERLIDVVVDTAKARVADVMKDEEGEGEGEVKQGKISSLIGLE